jgi:hypothetical protein
MINIKSQCAHCKWFLMNRSCLAFDLIPEGIWSGDRTHSKPADDDRGVRFSPMGSGTIDKQKAVAEVGESE